MEQNTNQIQTADKNQTPATFVDARVAMSRDGQYVLHFFADGAILRRSANFRI